MWAMMWGSVVIFRSQKGLASKKFEKHCCSRYSDQVRPRQGKHRARLPAAGYTWTDYKTNTQITKELKITPILDKLPEYKRNWIQHINRMPSNRLYRVMKHYSPTGRRNSGYVTPERVNKWPNSMTDRWWWWWLPVGIRDFFSPLRSVQTGSGDLPSVLFNWNGDRAAGS
jgi:hypothetical protein